MPQTRSKTERRDTCLRSLPWKRDDVSRSRPASHLQRHVLENENAGVDRNDRVVVRKRAAGEPNALCCRCLLNSAPARQHGIAGGVCIRATHATRRADCSKVDSRDNISV